MLFLQVETHGFRQAKEGAQFLFESVFVGRFLSKHNFDELVVLVEHSLDGVVLNPGGWLPLHPDLN